MKKVYFETRYFHRRIEIQLSDELFQKLTNHATHNPYTLYLHDAWAYDWNENPSIFSSSQLKRLKGIEQNGDFIDNIEVDGIKYDSLN